MRTIVTTVVLVICCALLLPAEATAQQKLAQTGMKFLNILPDARAVALGEAFTAVPGTSSSLFYNPSAMAQDERDHIRIPFPHQLDCGHLPYLCRRLVQSL